MKILFIDACISIHPESRTRLLCEEYLKQAETKGKSVERLELESLSLVPLTSEMLAKREALIQKGQYEDEMFAPACRFKEADEIVIGAPYHDFSFPSILKVYIEHIMVNGLTFRYHGDRTEGLCRASSLTYITTAGSYIGNRNYGYEYVKAVAERLGIQETNLICADGLDVGGADAAQIMREKLNLLSECRTIPYPQSYRERLRDEGATAFAGLTDHSGSRYYTANDYYNWSSNETLHILSRFETYQQTTEYTCGAACALMVLNWFDAKKYHEKLVAQLIESMPGRGSTVENIVDFFDLIGWNVEYHAAAEPKFQSIEELEQSLIDYIDRGIPIMVDWVDWAGHWQVIIGIDTCGSDTPYDDVLIFADPYDVTDHCQDGYYIFPLGRFYGMWREGPCAGKTTPYSQPFIAAWPQEPKKPEAD